MGMCCKQALRQRPRGHLNLWPASTRRLGVLGTSIPAEMPTHCAAGRGTRLAVAHGLTLKTRGSVADRQDALGHAGRADIRRRATRYEDAQHDGRGLCVLPSRQQPGVIRCAGRRLQASTCQFWTHGQPRRCAVRSTSARPTRMATGGRSNLRSCQSWFAAASSVTPWWRRTCPHSDAAPYAPVRSR